ncbi:MAG: TetR/AcrR family transcriptional regulator [Bacteroidales bacterium]|jgi:AcrR family transcriptional regulator|nr:TetR/AcrR family transcriptional regulator [Bacteroidales bacterium]
MRTKDKNKEIAIFESTLKLIQQQGIAGITMAKIAEQANIATGTLYIYFTNKEELITALYEKLCEQSTERFFIGYSDDLPYKMGLKKVWTNYLNHRINFNEESVFLEQYYRSPYITERQKQMAEKMKEPVYYIIERGKKEGLIKDNADTEMLFSSMLGFIRELAQDHVEKRYDLTDERIEKAFDISWDAIKK